MAAGFWAKAARAVWSLASGSAAHDDGKGTSAGGVIANVAGLVVSAVGAKAALVGVGIGLVAVAAVVVGVGLILLVTMGVGAAFAGAGADEAEALAAVKGVPRVAAQAYVTASRAAAAELECVLDPAVLAAVGAVQSGHGGLQLDSVSGVAHPAIYGPSLGADTDQGLWDGDPEGDRTVGPMLLPPPVWNRWPNGDPLSISNPQSMSDAARVAAWQLCSGGPADLTDTATLAAALSQINPAVEWAASVVASAGRYRLLTYAWGGTRDPAELLDHPGFSVSDQARADLEAGIVSPRLVGILWALASTWDIRVGVIQSGHSRCVAGTGTGDSCTESHHWYGRGADIMAVAGSPVSSNNREAAELVGALSVLPAGSGIRPEEVGSPFVAFNPLRGFFTDYQHLGHIHLAVCGERRSGGDLEDTCT